MGEGNKLETPLIRSIIIEPACGGYIVRVGCQTFVFTSSFQLLNALEGYLTNPLEVEKRYLGGGPQPAEPTRATEPYRGDVARIATGTYSGGAYSGGDAPSVRER